jgi:hypothetical protein
MGHMHFDAVKQDHCYSQLTNMALKTLEPESWLLEQVFRHNYEQLICHLNPNTTVDDYLDSDITSNPLSLVIELG